MATGQADEPATRDEWYYVAYAKDACGNVSAASAVAGGALDYFLGDVSDGVTAGAGDNTVAAADVSLLGAHYGASGAALSGFEYLDVGPTADHSALTRPATDGALDFEDLMMVALDYAPRVSLLRSRPAAVTSVTSADQVSANGPASVTAGQDFDVTIVVNGAGDLLGLSTKLAWNAAVAAPTGLVTAGTFLTAQGGTVLSPGAGRADAALLGPPAGITGMGTVATVRFHAIAAGDPQVTIDQVTGRDNANQDVAVQVMSGPLAASDPVRQTELQPVIPNPAPGHATLAYALAVAGPVDLAIYSVDGRRVRTLVHSVHSAGRFTVRWNGADDAGVAARSGVYFARFAAPGVRSTRLFTVVR
jgi:hypothetical protein